MLPDGTANKNQSWLPVGLHLAASGLSIQPSATGPLRHWEECPMGILWITIHIILHIWDYTLSISNFPILTKFHAVKGTHVISRQVIKNMTRRRKGKCKTGPLNSSVAKDQRSFQALVYRTFSKRADSSYLGFTNNHYNYLK